MSLRDLLPYVEADDERAEATDEDVREALAEAGL